MKLAFIALLFAGLCPAEERPRITWLRVSQISVMGAVTADVASSWGQYETNPVLGRGQFGARQIAIKGGLSGGGIYAWNRLGARHPKIVTTVNFGLTALLGFAAAHNLKER